MECIGSNQRYDTHTLSVLFFSFFFFFFFLLQLTFFVFSVQQNNATVTSPFTARFGVKGYEVVPASTEFEEGTGHHHVIVDGDYMERGTVIPADATHLHYGKAQKEGEITLEPGTHTLTLQFANGKHVSYGKKFASTITVVVE
jgi:hypothetical protein|tara:strand:+ start:127 stop:555 length:429 start_codon:yes stop_codon:yes gene_type:complete